MYTMIGCKLLCTTIPTVPGRSACFLPCLTSSSSMQQTNKSRKRRLSTSIHRTVNRSIAGPGRNVASGSFVTVNSRKQTDDSAKSLSLQCSKSATAALAGLLACRCLRQLHNMLHCVMLSCFLMHSLYSYTPSHKPVMSTGICTSDWA